MKSNRQPHSAILPDGSVNVSLLQLEIGQELADETRYAAEDSMKKRAIHMSKDYDEFEKFVSVSQLKPLQSSDVKELFTYRHGRHASGSGNGNGSFGQIPVGTGVINHVRRMEGNQPGCDSALNNSIQNTRNKSVHTKTTTAEKKVTKKKKVKKKSKNGKASDASEVANADTDAAIKNAMQLESEWRKLCTCPSSTLQYLLLLPMEGTRNVRDADGMDPTELVNLAASRLRYCTFEYNSSTNTCTRSRTLRLEPYDIVRLCKFEIQSGTMEGVLNALDLLIIAMPDIASPHSSSTSTSTTASLSPCASALEEMSTTSTSATISTDVMYDMIAIGNFVYRWMDSLTKCGRFSLHADFLSAKQKGGVDRILSFLEDVHAVYSLAVTCRDSKGKIEADGDSDNVSRHPSITYMTENLPSLRKMFLGS